MAPVTGSRVQSILDQLRRVEVIRADQVADRSLLVRVQALKAFQQERFRGSYQDLLSNQRYERAASFFLEELYGPGDFSGRDAQFARVVPALVRLFPASVVDAVELLCELHALSESLDDAMARSVSTPVHCMADYIVVWRSLDHLALRQQQLRMVLDLGRQLDRLTRNRLLRQSLRWMRPAAHAAGLEQLQRFLERGFDGFSAIQGSDAFLSIIEFRELQFLRDTQAASHSTNMEHARD